MRTAKEIQDMTDWKKTSLQVTKEKMPLWAMLGIADRALEHLSVFGDEETQAIALKAQEDIRMVAVRYELKELLGMLSERLTFKIDERDRK